MRSTCIIIFAVLFVSAVNSHFIYLKRPDLALKKKLQRKLNDNIRREHGMFKRPVNSFKEHQDDKEARKKDPFRAD